MSSPVSYIVRIPRNKKKRKERKESSPFPIFLEDALFTVIYTDAFVKISQFYLFVVHITGFRSNRMIFREGF